MRRYGHLLKRSAPCACRPRAIDGSGVRPGSAAADPVGTVTGLPLPRYASLKTDRVNLREGPSKEHATKWV